MVSIMFHSAGLNRYPWRSSHISDSLGSMSMKLKALSDAGFETVRMEDACADRDRRSRRVLLTFDDGYLDNWVHVFPMLERYELRATLFVTPEFVDPRDIIRPQISAEEVDDFAHRPATCCAGFLSWRELRTMEESGLVDVQCHGLTHTWYFKGPNIVDFWHPGAASEKGGAVWMLWNRFPEWKPFYLTEGPEREDAIPYGTPIYEHGKALETRRFFPHDDELNRSIQERISVCTDGSFFENEGWRTELYSLVEQHERRTRPASSGCFESDEAYRERIRHELWQSKKRIEEELQKNVSGLCWPGGGVTEEVVEVAREVGYRYFTLPSKWTRGRVHGCYDNMIPRIESLQTISVKGMVIGRPTAREFLWHVNKHRGALASRFLGRLSQIWRLIMFVLGRTFK